MAFDSRKLVVANRTIAEDLRRELILQGHSLTGALEKSIVHKTFFEGNLLVMEGYALSYIGILEDGTDPDKIPYNPNEKSGKSTSKYIQALQNYAKQRMGLSDKEALSVAFAIAKKQKKEGMPTKGSYRYSKTGMRKNAIDFVLTKNTGKYNDRISESIDSVMDIEFNKQKTESI